jgi:hypothetical protein
MNFLAALSRKSPSSLSRTGVPMNLDYPTLDAMRRQHPAWRLLLADHAPLIASFLQRIF